MGQMRETKFTARPRPLRRRRVHAGRLVVVLAVLFWLVSIFVFQPAARLVAGTPSVGRVDLVGPSHVVSAVATVGGRSVLLSVGRTGNLWPDAALPAGKAVTVTVSVAPPAFIAWLPGEVREISRTMYTPKAPALQFHHETVTVGQRVVLAFTRAGEVRGLGAQTVKVVPDHDTAAAVAEAQNGQLRVETRARSWEAWSSPIVLNWTGVDPDSSVLALQKDLAELGYLPLKWEPLAGGAGRFVWLYPMPTSLTSLWVPGTDNVLTTGAVWQFERETGLPVETPTDAEFWSDLDAKLAAHQVNTEGYTYVQVSQGRPERLRLWFNGKLVINSLANTAKPPGITHVGTFPVFLRYTSQAMTGYDPATGQSYYYPHVPWVNYFKGNDAVHGFPRKHYGFPQSAGCVELPIATAKRVYTYMHYGTLVTVLPIPSGAT